MRVCVLLRAAGFKSPFTAAVCWWQEGPGGICRCLIMCVCSHAIHMELPTQLSTVLAIYWEVQVRYPGVAMTTINSALSSIHHSDEEARLHQLESFSNNMLLILNRLLLTDSHSKHIRYIYLTMPEDRKPIYPHHPQWLWNTSLSSSSHNACTSKPNCCFSQLYIITRMQCIANYI